MTKSELVEQVADRAGLSRGQAAEALQATLAAIEQQLAAGGDVIITGFGRFSVTERAPVRRATRAPASGSKSPPRAARFAAGSRLKHAIAAS
jgi:DNA-binding protein HU-beta